MFAVGVSAMNLKLSNNNVRRSVHSFTYVKPTQSIKEERQRTGRYIAILVGICLFLLAIYHAWVRRIPIVASLVVPALIMFIYVAWVLFTASRDKHRLLDAEAALRAAQEAENEASVDSVQNNIEVSLISSKETSKTTVPEDRTWAEISTALTKGETKDHNFIKPVILVNDRPPEDLDEKWKRILEKVANCEKFKIYQTKRKFKRKFCRSRRNAVFKRSYSIA